MRCHAFASLLACAACSPSFSSSAPSAAGDASSGDAQVADAGAPDVVAAGSRRLGLEVNPPPAFDYVAKLDVAAAAGVHVVPFSLGWSYLETSPDGGPPRIDPTLFRDLDIVFDGRDTDLLVTIPLVDTVSVLAPADLEPGLSSGSLAFDDPSVVARYEKLLDVLFATLGSNVRLRYLLVANEANIYLVNRPDVQWTSLERFFEAIRAYVAARRPGVTVGMNVAFEGLLDSTIQPKLAALDVNASTVFVSYYLGNNGFGHASSTNVQSDFDTMISFAGARPVVVKEFGYPTGTSDHSLDGQAAFVTDFFQAWDTHVDAMPVVVFSRMFDGNPTDCAAQAAAYGAAGNQDFIAFLCTLGLRAIDDAAKPAWARFVDGSQKRGF
jgi:hypothetical protein